MRLAKSRIHFIGIGGIGMCGLAELLHNMGVQVKGSDLSENMQTIRLRELGIQVQIGHVAENMNSVDVAVYSSAVKPSNVEFQEAKRRGIPLIPRAEALAEMMRMKKGVAIAGSHGKTTTTSLTAAVFLDGKLDPTIVVGGRLDLIKSTAKLGASEWIVAEADESDGSFNRLSPEIVVITNIDNDHLDYYGNFKNLQKAFYEFATRIPFYGAVILCGDDKETLNLFKDFPKRLVTYGVEHHNDYILKPVKGKYEVWFQGSLCGSFTLKIPGRHNALNALAAAIAGHMAGLSFERALRGLESFHGVDRRFQKKYEFKGVSFYDDYGHHPTEIRAVISAFKEKYPKRPLKILFQPHRYSRTSALWRDFLSCFEGAAQVAVLDIYEAGESPEPGITSERLVKEMDHPKAIYYSDKNKALSETTKNLKPEDVFVTLGAGDIWKLGEEIARRVGSL